MPYRGRIENGMVVLDEGVSLPEGAEVEVELVHETRRPGPDSSHGPSLYDRLKPVIGKARGLPPDASTNVDHYLYGHPKR